MNRYRPLRPSESQYVKSKTLARCGVLSSVSSITMNKASGSVGRGVGFGLGSGFGPGFGSTRLPICTEKDLTVSFPVEFDKTARNLYDPSGRPRVMNANAFGFPPRI